MRTARDVFAAAGELADEVLFPDAMRLAREALFLLVFGSRPGIKNALLDQLGAGAVPSGRA
jgi:hypothetical protein